MKLRPLGRTGLSVSEICLGTMTWGGRNGENEAHARMDRALAAGVNVIDTARMAPAFRPTRPFMTSLVIGVTATERSDPALGAPGVTLSADVREGHRRDPSPLADPDVRPAWH